MSGNKKLRKKPISESTIYSTTSEDDSTISPSLKARKMPKYYNGFIAGSSASSSSTSVSSYVESEDEGGNQLNVGRDGGRTNPGRERSKSPDDVLVSLNDTIAEKKSSKDGNEICCKHGRPCAIGRRNKAAKAKENYKKAPEYEVVKISKLENPPASFAVRRPKSAATNDDKDEQIVYHCKYPSDLSSIQTPSSTSQEATDGVYENIDWLKKTKKSISSASSVDTAHDVSVAERSHRRRRNASNNIEDLYLGPITRRQAEKHVRRNTQFRVYHRVPTKASQHIDYLKDHISLCVAYKSTQGDYHHYPIQRCHGPSGGKQYYIDCGENDRMVFNSLDALVSYYSVYVRFDTNDEIAEVFPSKHRHRGRKSTREDEVCKSKRNREKRKNIENEVYY